MNISNNKLEIITCSPEETKALGIKLAKKLKKGDIIALKGGLGSGKTTFVQGMLDFYGINKFARSASFVIVNEYRAKSNKIFHMDLYRLDASDINRFGLEEYMSNDGITVIEWADKLKYGAISPAYEVSFKYRGELKRKITIITVGKKR